MSRQTFDQAKAALAEAVAQTNYAQQGFVLAKIGPRIEDIDAARAAVAVEQADMIQAERRMSDAELLAPSPGVILTRSRKKGPSSPPAKPSSRSR